MRFAILLFSLFTSLSTQSAPLDGRLVIRRADGSFHDLRPTLEVPTNLSGEYRLTLDGNHVASHATVTRQAHDRTFFSIVFIDPMQTNRPVAMKLVGNYLQGAKKTFFQGTVYSGLFSSMEHPCQPDDNGEPQCPRPQYRHSGFFVFETP